MYREVKYHTEVERFKESLIQRFDWSPHLAYEAIDVRCEGAINLQQLKRYLLTNGYTPYDAELDAIMRRLDSDSDFLLSKREFMDIFQSKAPLKPIQTDYLTHLS